MKTCTKCKEIKDETSFNKNQNWCKLCDNQYHREHYLKNKKYYIDKSKKQRDKLKNYVLKIKLNTPCSKCGESHPACLDFHHLGDKIDEIAGLVNKGVSLKTLKIEIDKCIVLCSNCHRKIHYAKNGDIM